MAKASYSPTPETLASHRRSLQQVLKLATANDPRRRWDPEWSARLRHYAQSIKSLTGLA